MCRPGSCAKIVESGKSNGWRDPIHWYGSRVGFTATSALIRSRTTQPLATSIPGTVSLRPCIHVLDWAGQSRLQAHTTGHALVETSTAAGLDTVPNMCTDVNGGERDAAQAAMQGGGALTSIPFAGRDAVATRSRAVIGPDKLRA